MQQPDTHAEGLASRSDAGSPQITSVDAGPGQRQGLWHNFGVQDGLPSSSVLTLAQDQRGDLWFGTYNGGLCHYDGAQFTTFTGWSDSTDHTIALAFGATLLADRQGRLWFAARSKDIEYLGIYAFDGAQFTAFLAREQIPHKNVCPVLEDRRGHLWFFATDESLGYSGRAGDLFRYDGRALVAFTAGGVLPERGITSMLEDRHGHLWFGTKDSDIYRYDGEECIALDTQEGLTDEDIRVLHENRHGHLWFCSGTDLHRYDGEQFTTLSVPDVQEDAQVIDLVEDLAGHLWISVLFDKVYRYDGQTFTCYTTLDGLAHNSVLDMLVDRDGALWFATHGGGVSRYDGTQLQSFTTEDGLGGNHTYSILEDGHNDLWFGTHTGGVSRYDGARMEAFTQQDGLAGNSVWGIAENSQGRLFFANRDSGLVAYDGEVFRSIEASDGQEDYRSLSPLSLLADRQGRLWIGCWYGAVLRYDDDECIPIETNDAVDLGSVRSIVEIRSGDLFVCSGRGLYRYDGEKLAAFPGPQKEWSFVQALCEDRQGHLWIGSRYTGLHRYDGRDNIAFTMRDGLAENHIRCITEDDRGHLWIGTFGGGVSRYDGLVFQRLSRHDGLIHDTVNAIHQDQNGDIWIATEGGLTRYRSRRTAPTVRLTDLVADRRYGPVDALKLQASQQFVSCEFQGRSLSTGPDRMAYVYRLVGHDDPWRPTYDRRVDYRDLPVGEYTFEVKAVDRDLNYSDPASVRLQIIPAERDRRIDELEQRVKERTAALEAANVQLTTRAREAEIAAAVERIRTQVFSMQQAEDLDQVVLALGGELQGLDIPFHHCGLQILGEGGLHAERIALRHGSTAVSRTRTSGWQAHTSVYEAWDKQQVVYRADLQQDNPYGEESLIEAGLHCVIDVPFRYGTLALSSECPDAYWPPDIEILQALAAAIEGAYARHLDFQALEESNRQIQAATRHKSDFLARMSHDLRTPMNAIIGYTRILLRRAVDKLEPRQFQNLENIESSAQSLLSLINEILDLSRIESGRVEVNAEDVDVKKLVVECATSIAPLVKREVELQQELADVPALCTDADLMRRVVMNILGNAVKFTEQGRITVALKSIDTGVELSIADTGLGIPAADLPHIFEEFRQVGGQGAIKTQEGSGLGLAIVKKTVELLGGAIRAESAVGEGTTFTLRIINYK